MIAEAPSPPIPPTAFRRAAPWRILFVTTSSDVGGTETFLRELVLRLDTTEFAPVVCSLRPCGRSAQAIREAGIPVLSTDMADEPRPRELVRGVLALVRWLDEFDVDLVQSFLYRANALAGIAARFARRRPWVIRGQRSLYPLGGWRAAFAARWTKGLSDLVVAVSGAVRDELVKTEHVAPERIRIIENGVDTTRFQVPADDGVRRQLGFDPKLVLVGGMGRLSQEKGFHLLIERVALARRRGAPLALVLAGDGPERRRLEKQAHNAGLNEAVRFLGVCADPRPAYAAMDIFALPSLEEGAPNALLEAMACGRAVVAHRVGGVPEVVEHDRSGLLIDPRQPSAFADALVRLAAEPGLRRRLGAEAARRVHERFDVARMVERHVTLYREILSGKPIC